MYIILKIILLMNLKSYKNSHSNGIKELELNIYIIIVEHSIGDNIA